MNQKLKNLSIRRKLTLSFGTIIFFCTIAAIIGALGIGSVFVSSRTLYTDYGQSQGNVNRMLADFKQNELLTNTLLVNTNPQGQETLLSALDANKAELLERFTESDELGYFNGLPDETLQEFELLLKQYFETQHSVVTLAVSGQKTQAIRLFTQSLMVEGEQVDNIIRQIILAQAQAGQSMLTALGRSTVRIMIVLAVFVFLSLIYSIVVSRKMSASIGQSVQGLLNGMDGLGSGDLGTRVEVLSQDDFGRIAESFNHTCQVLDGYVSHVNHTMAQIASGRLIYDDDLVFQGDFLTMQRSIMRMVEQQNQLIRVVQDTTGQVASASEQVSASAQSLAQGATEQAGSVQELSASFSVFSRQMSNAVGDAAVTTENAEQAGTLAKAADEKMQQMLSAMEEITASTRAMEQIAQSIDGIASQTNLLALNAAVEAARAGNAGKGFGVIADTVRHLALKSSEEAQATARLLQSTRDAVSTGKHLAADAAELLHDTSNASSQSVLSTAKVLDVLTGQFAALEQIHAGLDQISSVIQTNSAAAEESAAASEELQAQSTALEQHVSIFSLD